MPIGKYVFCCLAFQKNRSDKAKIDDTSFPVTSPEIRQMSLIQRMTSCSVSR